jgi:hypothetical protein
MMATDGSSRHCPVRRSKQYGAGEGIGLTQGVKAPAARKPEDGYLGPTSAHRSGRRSSTEHTGRQVAF